MLLGEHEHALDDKNRLTLPARQRDQLGDRVVVTRGLDGCLYVYAAAEWAKLAERVGTLDPLSREARTMQRFFFASGTEAELDKQGRVMIPTRDRRSPSRTATSLNLAAIAAIRRFAG